MKTTSQLLESTLEDLADDLDELLWLAESDLARLSGARVEVESAASSFRRSTYRTIVAQLSAAEAFCRSHMRASQKLLRSIRTRDRSDVEMLRRARDDLRDSLRTQQGLFAALIVGSDWQSPALLSSRHPTAGRHTGRVTEHHDDYKRDRHPGARAFELSYVKEYVDARPGTPVMALMTSCGMAAFTTILEYICTEILPEGPILAGRGIYHECRHRLSRIGPRTDLWWVDETDATELIDACRRLRPRALFVDSMCNSKGLGAPDLPALVGHLAAAATTETFLVVDNTCASVMLQPFALAAPHPRLHPIVFESLTKYAQFGFDRTAAGVIIAREDDALALDDYREHLGTNVSDQCAEMVPEPRRALLVRRLRRIERNAALLAAHLAELCDEKPGPLAGVCYPGLDGHRSRPVALRQGFTGGLLALEFSSDWDCPEGHGKVARALIEEARRGGVPLVAGASFGLNVTRVYRTATEVGLGPFVRIAAGTEDRGEIERLKQVLENVTRRLKRPGRPAAPADGRWAEARLGIGAAQS
jgi:cystathionine beta-lyase/cystathionine gamma-synthase